MNWERAKNRLIILFLMINLLLVWANYKKELGIYTLKETQVNDIRKVLENNNIYVDSTIPKDYRPLKKLTVLPYQIDSSIREKIAKQILGEADGLTVSVENPKTPNEQPKRIYRKGDQIVVFNGESVLYQDESIIDAKGIIDINQAKKMADKWIARMEYNAGAMYMQIIQQADDFYIMYYEQYEGVPIFDSYIKIHITSQGISEAMIRKVRLGELIGKEQNIYSADQVLLGLITTITKNQPIHIRDIVIGYALENPKGTHLIAEEAIPFYQIILEDGEVYYINAYNNDLRDETPPTMEDLQ